MQVTEIHGTETAGFIQSDGQLFCKPCGEKACNEGDPKLKRLTLNDAWSLAERGAWQCAGCTGHVLELALKRLKLR